MSSQEINTLSVIIPVLNDANALEENLQGWQARRGGELTIITVDGGSNDRSYEIGCSLSDICLASESGRARQMNEGARLAAGRYFLFLHADTRIPEDSYRSLVACLEDSNPSWGFFHVYLNNPRWIYRIIEKLMNWRSTVTQVATGDQCLFVSKEAFEKIGGFTEIPLMEDVAITKKLRQTNAPKVLNKSVNTSTRRWEQHGVAKTIVLMWLLRTAFFLGVSPARLHRFYY